MQGGKKTGKWFFSLNSPPTCSFSELLSRRTHTLLPFPYRVWCVDEGSLRRRNDCTARFSRARSWQSHFLCNFMVVFLNEDIGCSEARGQSLPAPFSGLFRSMFPFTWWKVIHHLHPWILPLSSLFSSPLLSSLSFFFPVTTFLASLIPWCHLWRCWEMNWFNTAPGQPSQRTG